MTANRERRWKAFLIPGLLLVTMATVVTTGVLLWPTWREYIMRMSLGEKTTPQWWPASWREELHVRRILARPTDLSFEGLPLDQACDRLSSQTGLKVVLDKAGLSEARVPTDAPVRFPTNRISLRTALRLMLNEYSLTCFIEHDKLVVTSRSVAAGLMTPRTSPSLVSCGVEFLESDDPILAREAAYTLGDNPTDAAALPKMIHALEDDDDDIQLNIIYALGRLGPDAAPAIPPLRELFIKSDDPWVWRQVFAACCEIGESGVPVVVFGLKSVSYSDRRWTVEWLEKQAPAALEAVVDQLAVEARQSDMRVSARAWTALRALERYGTMSVPLVQAATTTKSAARGN